MRLNLLLGDGSSAAAPAAGAHRSIEGADGGVGEEAARGSRSRRRQSQGAASRCDPQQERAGGCARTQQTARDLRAGPPCKVLTTGSLPQGTVATQEIGTAALRRHARLVAQLGGDGAQRSPGVDEGLAGLGFQVLGAGRGAPPGEGQAGSGAVAAGQVLQPSSVRTCRGPSERTRERSIRERRT